MMSQFIQSVISLWSFVTGTVSVPLPILRAMYQAAIATKHSKTVASMSCLLFLQGGFCLAWWICGNVW